MHQYRLPAVNATYPPAEVSDEEVEGELIPYAHRDIKPACVPTTRSTSKRLIHRNIMIADDGSPVLMDFGSTTKWASPRYLNTDGRARIDIQTRQQALLEQDIASEHCSMPYRAPELFDVKTGKMLDEKVDIWVSPDHALARLPRPADHT
mgnify:CR=1 FL=1|jgi:serine/threonine kinase 16